MVVEWSVGGEVAVGVVCVGEVCVWPFSYLAEVVSERMVAGRT